jgi:DNA-binding XRE family transcriptional regulator
MTVEVGGTKPWDTDEYQRIVDAAFDGGELIVRFGDGAEARVDVTLMTRVEQRGPDWASLRFDDFEIVVPTREGDFEIPWFPIRSLTDPAFRAHLDAAAVEQARWIGERIRALRLGHGLGVEELAARAGLKASTLVAIEHGNREVHLVGLERLLSAMGHDFGELVRPESVPRLAASQTA